MISVELYTMAIEETVLAYEKDIKESEVEPEPDEEPEL